MSEELKLLNTKINVNPSFVTINVSSVSHAVSGDPHAMASLLYALIYFVGEGPMDNQKVWDHAIDILSDKTKEDFRKRVGELFESDSGGNI